jgi:hypothetical protein
MLLLQEGRAARVRWLLDGRRRRERAALWGALRELLPEHVLEGLGQGAEMEAHVKQVVVLQAEVEAGEGAGAGAGDMALAATEALHELLTVWDREVLSFHAHKHRGGVLFVSVSTFKERDRVLVFEQNIYSFRWLAIWLGGKYYENVEEKCIQVANYLGWRVIL